MRAARTESRPIPAGYDLTGSWNPASKRRRGSTARQASSAGGREIQRLPNNDATQAARGPFRERLFEAGLRKAAIGSLGGDLRTGAALGIEPVISSLAGACLPPLVTFRSTQTPNARIATTAMLSSVRPLGLSQCTSERFRIAKTASLMRRGDLTIRALTDYLEFCGVT